MHLFAIYTVAGIINGMVYAAVALALVMIWRATRIINYAQGAMAMFTTYIALVCIQARCRHTGSGSWSHSPPDS